MRTQQESQWKKEVKETLFIHSPLPLHPEKSLEACFPNKKVLQTKVLWESSKSPYQPLGVRKGTVSVETIHPAEVIRLTAPLRADEWPEGAAPDGDYSNFGVGMLKFQIDNENWESFNRLRFWLKPDIFGARVLHLNVAVVNEGKIPVPDVYFREGATVFDLENHQWKEYFWEFPSMGRDKITELIFYVYLSGTDVAGDDFLTYYFKEIRLEQVEDAEWEKGWECRENQLVLSTLGYFPKGEKIAIARAAKGEEASKEEWSHFALVEAESGERQYENTIRKLENEKGSFYLLDFTEWNKPGRYYLETAGLKSEEFLISESLMEEAVWKTINFLYCLRCGTPVVHRHGSCHQDMLAEHNGVKVSFAGGWHDAGDVSQQAAQTGEVVHSLLEAAEKAKEDPYLYRRLLEEAGWGLDYILKTRFGDGFRATSAGATRFTDGKIGNMDDIEVRVFDHSFENFLFAGIEAYAGYIWREEDPDYAYGARKAAKEDFDFAERKFRETGVEPANIYEHTYNSGESQYYAVAAWAAANLQLAWGEEVYGEKAAEYGRKLLACQETGEAGLPFTGFFYRDERKKSIVHFNHQSREHQFMQALELLCRTQPSHPDRPKWEEAMERYAGYLKYLIPSTAPFGMLPAGVYRTDEPEDKDTFQVMHILVDYEGEKENYRRQLQEGKWVDDRHVIKNFPVWFSFRGNSAVHLSMGKAASILGHYFQDEELLQAGREQLYWLYGKNPFGQSLHYGLGSRYCAQYAVLAGESAGELPVGIETWGNEDVPYWPQNNNATYKEVWTSAASRFLWLAADYLLVNPEW